MSKSKAVGPSLTKHVEVGGVEHIVKFHMEGDKFKVESINDDADVDVDKLFSEKKHRNEWEHHRQTMIDEYPKAEDAEITKIDQDEAAAASENTVDPNANAGTGKRDTEEEF